MSKLDGSEDHAASFKAKQKEFREQVAQAKAKADSQSSAAVTAATAKAASNNNSEIGESKSSKSSATRTNKTEKKGVKGALDNIIYGTKEGREMDAEIERSFSQALARGKYVHSIVMHEVKPDKVDEYVELVGSWYPKVAEDPNNHVHLVGSWRTEVGDCDTFSEW
jgi:hypothetical protein